ncbi:DUF3450 domain-containing protein [Pseudomonadales bacterium]|nr:DUF3450 domain-containing protein [Pseudomonadales bacterium]
MIRSSFKKTNFPDHAAAKAYAIANINLKPVIRRNGPIYSVEMNHGTTDNDVHLQLIRAREQNQNLELKTEQQEKIIANQRDVMAEQKGQINSLKEQIKKFEQALNITFGNGEWQILNETVNTESYQTCGVCMGDGGAGGNCYKCNGRGGQKVPVKKDQPTLTVR